MTPSPVSRRSFLGLLGAGLLTAGCGAGSDEQSAGPSAAPSAGADAADDVAGRTVRVATFTKNHASSPLYWPQFAPPGLTVEVSTLGSGNDMNNALEAGNLDFALFGLVNGFVQAEQGLGSKVVCMGAEKGAGMIVRKDAPYRDVADLRGRKIGFFGPSFQYLLLLELLDGAGLDPNKDVTLVSVPYNDQPAALAGGSVDAFMGSEPNPARSVADGTGRRLLDPYGTPAGSLNSCIWVSRRMAAEEPALVRAAVRMQRAAAEKLSPGGRNDPAVFKDLLVTQFGYPEAVYEDVLPNIGAVWRFDTARRAQAEAIGSLMSTLGLLKKAPDYAAVVDLTAQEAVAPGSSTG